MFLARHRDKSPEEARSRRPRGRAPAWLIGLLVLAGTAVSLGALAAPASAKESAPAGGGPGWGHTRTTLTVTPWHVTPGKPVILTATVTCTKGAPSGLVTFFELDNDTILGAVPLNAGGTATQVVRGLWAGTHAIIAEYGGDGTCWPSSSRPVIVTVPCPKHQPWHQPWPKHQPKPKPCPKHQHKPFHKPKPCHKPKPKPCHKPKPKPWHKPKHKKCPVPVTG
jgi:Bacterial Ig-like domain (group 3)